MRPAYVLNTYFVPRFGVWDEKWRELLILCNFSIALRLDTRHASCPRQDMQTSCQNMCTFFLLRFRTRAPAAGSVTTLPPPSICTPIRATCTVRRMQRPYVVTLRITCMGPARPNPGQAFDYNINSVLSRRFVGLLLGTSRHCRQANDDLIRTSYATERGDGCSLSRE